MDHPFEIVDAHVHYFDSSVNTYPWLEKTDKVFEFLYGDYSALPRKYLPEDYLKDSKGFNITRTVMAEIMSTDPIKEARFAQSLSDKYGHPHAIIALFNPLSSNSEDMLDQYSELPNVKAVRAHISWHSHNPILRGAEHPHILMQREWRKHFAALNLHDFIWEFEIFSSQIPEAKDLADNFPNIRMILHVQGWPEDVSEEGRKVWRKHIRELAKCDNVGLKVNAIGMIFKNLTIEEIKLWVRDAIDAFGPKRVMFGSNWPLDKLMPRGFTQLYLAYMDMVADLSLSERKKLFHDTPTAWYGLD